MTRPSGTAGRGGVDPRFVTSVREMVRLVLDEQDHHQVQTDADAATREASPPRRPALRRLYDVAGAADQLSLSESKIWALIRAGRLRTVKVDTRTLIAAVELDRFVAEEVRSG